MRNLIDVILNLAGYDSTPLKALTKALAYLKGVKNNNAHSELPSFQN